MLFILSTIAMHIYSNYIISTKDADALSGLGYKKI